MAVAASGGAAATAGASAGTSAGSAIWCNAVTLPDWVRFDAAAYLDLSDRLALQLNVENLGDKDYFTSAHSNNNISPGAPRSAWVITTLRGGRP